MRPLCVAPAAQGGNERMAQPGFFQELKRRHVWRVAAAYAVMGWLLIQVATQVFPIFHMPDWTAQLVVLLVLLGFPVAMIFAWVFEMTPKGIRRTEPVGSPEVRPEYERLQIGRKLNTVIIAVLVLAVALLGWRLLVVVRNGPNAGSQGKAQRTAFAGLQTRTAKPAQRGRSPGMTVPDSTAGADPSGLRDPAQTAAFHPPAGTLVVLPFADLGVDASRRYFSDGITEELTNALGQNTGLRVIAWDTASKFRDGKQSARDVGRALNVANVLTGKILRQNNEVRVNVELVNAQNGYQVWSTQYDDSLKNIFAVQDKISASIADALKVKFASTRVTKSINPRAHDLVLQVRALTQTARDAASYRKARTLLEQAIALDPDYAEAYAQLARAWFNLTQFSTLSLKDALPKILAEVHEALALDPANVSALIVLANVDATEGKIASAKAGYQRALQLDPSNAFAHLDYALVLPREQGLAETLEAVQLDPDNATAQNNLAANYMDSGEYEQALPASLALARLAPHGAGSAFGLAINYALLHRDQDAIKAFDLVHPDTSLGKQLVAAGKLAYQSVLDPSLRAQALAAADALRKRPDLDPDSLYNLFIVYLVLDKQDVALDLLDRSCVPVPFSCSDFAVNPTYIPLRGNPRFEALEKKYDTTSQPPASASSSSSQ